MDFQNMDLALYPHLFWRADPEEYDCSNKSYEEWEATGSPSPFLAAYFFIFGVVVMICYVIVIISMTDGEILRQQCYKIMYFNCFIDFGNLITNSVVTGILFWHGSVFCTWPFASFFFGALGVGCWSASCFNCITIGINRCCTMFDKCSGIFDGWRVYIWIGSSLSLLMFMMSFTRTPIFNSALGAWFYYPFIQPFEVEMMTIKNFFHPLINIATAFMITLLYAMLCGFIVVSKDSFSNNGNNSNQVAKAQYRVFVQSVVICLSTCAAAYLYVLMQFFTVPSWVILAASLAYQMCSAVPCFVYLTLNSSVRRRAVKLIHGQWSSAHVTLTALSKRGNTQVTTVSLRSGEHSASP